MLYSQTDFHRIVQTKRTKREVAARPEFWRDYARLIHSPAFRRLQGKIQLFPGIESDFFRNRLTHSTEVAQIAKSLAMRINSMRISGRARNDKIDLDLVSFAGLAHDLGHPPFGHNGEEALDDCMRNSGGFEGNAQTLRILTKLEKKAISGKIQKTPVGLNLTYRTLAAVLKYDQVIPENASERPDPDKLCKGYYKSEIEIVEKIKTAVIGEGGKPSNFKTIECQIMDLADDIAYSTYDLEDALKAGFISPIDIMADALNKDFMTRVANKVNERTGRHYTERDVTAFLADLFLLEKLFDSRVFNRLVVKNAKSPRKLFINSSIYGIISYDNSKQLAEDGYLRGELTSSLVDRFINGVQCNWNTSAPQFSEVKLSDEILPLVETLKTYTFMKFIESSRIKVSEYRGREIVKNIFNALDSEDGSKLLPVDFKAKYDSAMDDNSKKRVICDFIAGMTDNYAIEFYCRLNSENPQSIFKPI